MEIPKNPYACATCHKRFNNPTILIKHVELRHSIAKKSQNGEPKENRASIENQDSLENTSTSLVPFEFTSITGNIEMIFPQEIEDPTEDQSEEIRDNHYEAVSVPEIFEGIDKNCHCLTSTDDIPIIKSIEMNSQDIEVPIKDKVEEIMDQDANFEVVSESKIKTRINKNECITSTENENPSIIDLSAPSNNSIISIKISNEHKSNSVYQEEKTFKCHLFGSDGELCRFSSGKKDILYKHIKTTHGSKTFKCKACPLSYSQKKHLKIHVISVHEGKPYKCEICGYATVKKQSLDKHILAVHERKKPFKCEFCGYATAHKKDLNKHIQAVHEGKKPFKCELCEYASANKHDLNQHIQAVHEGKKPFKCEFCEHASAYKQHLKQHIQAIHKRKK